MTSPPATVTLTISDTHSFTDSVSHDLTIANLAAVIWAAVSPGTPANTTSVAGNIPLTVIFDDTHSIGTGLVQWSWDWEWTDLGTPGIDATDFISNQDDVAANNNVQHTYATAGTYTAVLRVYDGVNWAYDTLTITTTEPPVVATCKITAGATEDANAAVYLGAETPQLPYVYSAQGALPISVTVDASDSTGNKIGYTWNFGDGTGDLFPILATDPTLTHNFTQEGIYQISVKVDGTSGSDYATMILTVLASGSTYLSHSLRNQGDNNDQDTRLYEGNPTSNWAGDILRVETTPNWQSHTVLQSKDFVTLVGSKTIFRGGVVLFCVRENGGGGGNDLLRMYRVTSSWIETTANWTVTAKPTYDSGTDYASDGAGYPIIHLASNNDEMPPHPFYVQCTNLVTSWVTTPATNYGAYLIGDAGASFDVSFVGDGYQGHRRQPMIIGILH
jgi:hypothetical protein